MANIVNEKMLNFKVYIDGNELLGIAEGNLPNGDMMTTEIKGAGLAGSIDAPVTGHFGSITVTLNWRTLTKAAVRLMTPDAHSLDMYADNESFDAGRGIVKHEEIHVFMKARTKNMDMGKLAVGDTSDTQTEHEVYYYKLYIDGSEVMEVDKYNYIYKVNGVDYLAQSRRNLGMV